LKFDIVKLEYPEGCNVILGMAQFIKTVEDLYEALINSCPSIRFGLAFCEASGPCLVRFEGNDEELQNIAVTNAKRLGCGHVFIIMLRDAYPINVIDRIRSVPEVCTIFAATANPLEVIVGASEQGNGVVGVIDGCRTEGIESAKDKEERRAFLRASGYKK
jgi:adenosine/AMP kinase